jgi:hypothetical protein
MPLNNYFIIETMLLVNGGDYDSYYHVPCGEEVPILSPTVLLSGGCSELLWKVGKILLP